MGQVFAQCEELIIIDGCLVAGVEHYVAVENNQFLQGVAEAERTEAASYWNCSPTKRKRICASLMMYCACAEELVAYSV